jgi:hypothetical protein
MESRWEAASMRRKAKRGKSNRAKTKLGLPDLEHAKSAVLVSLRSPELTCPSFCTRFIERVYITAIGCEF